MKDLFSLPEKRRNQTPLRTRTGGKVKTDPRVRELIRQLIQQQNNELKEEFQGLSDGGQYTEEQKQYAFRLLEKNGVRQTAVILDIPKRTIQRWCRQYDITVNRCPGWVYERSARWHWRQRFKQLGGRLKIENDGIKLSPLKKGQSAIEELEKRLNKQRSTKKTTNDTQNIRSREIDGVLDGWVTDSAIDWVAKCPEWNPELLEDWKLEELEDWNSDEADW